MSPATCASVFVSSSVAPDSSHPGLRDERQGEAGGRCRDPQTHMLFLPHVRLALLVRLRVVLLCTLRHETKGVSSPNSSTTPRNERVPLTGSKAKSDDPPSASRQCICARQRRSEPLSIPVCPSRTRSRRPRTSATMKARHSPDGDHAQPDEHRHGSVLPLDVGRVLPHTLVSRALCTRVRRVCRVCPGG